MIKEKKSKHNFSIEDSIWKEFKKCCIDKGKTATDIISEFIKKKVEQYERKIRQKK